MTVTVAGCAIDACVGHCELLLANMVIVMGGIVVVARQLGGWEDDSDVYAERMNVEMPDVYKRALELHVVAETETIELGYWASAKGSSGSMAARHTTRKTMLPRYPARPRRTQVALQCAEEAILGLGSALV